MENTNTKEGVAEEAANHYAEHHGFRVPYNGTNNFYDDNDVKWSKEGFIAGASWQAKQSVPALVLTELIDMRNKFYNNLPLGGNVRSAELFTKIRCFIDDIDDFVSRYERALPVKGKKWIIGKIYIIDKGFANSGEVELLEIIDDYYCLVKDQKDVIEGKGVWKTMINRLSPLKVNQP